MLRRPGFPATAFATIVAVLMAIGVSAPASAIVPVTPDPTLWQVDGRVRTIVQTDTAIYIGGLFTRLLGPSGQVVSRRNLAALDATTGLPLPLAPNPDKAVWELALSPDDTTLYVGGDFSVFGGLSRRRVASVDLASGQVRSWNPSASGQVSALYATTTSVYLGGSFLTVGGLPRTRLAKVSAATGALDPAWTPTADATVNDIEIPPSGTRVLVGGAFGSVSGSPGISQRALASLDPQTGALQPWAVHPSFQIFDLLADGTQVFGVGGGSGGHAVAFDGATGQQQWLGFADGDTVSVALVNGTVYVGGHFSKWEGAPASHAVALDRLTGQRRPWPITVNSNLGIFAVSGHGGDLVVGGDFTRVNRIVRNHLARFREILDTVPPSAPGQPVATAVDARHVSLSWARATDNAATSLVYSVYRNGGATPIGTVQSAATTVTFLDAAVSPDTDYDYTIVANDGVQDGPPSLASNTVHTPPAPVVVPTAISMLDQNTNGRVDRIHVVFSAPVTCSAPCLTPWVLTDLPVGTVLSDVELSGSDVWLNLTEGWGPRSTAVGAATVALTASTNGVLSSLLDPVGFAATSPSDDMAPVPIDLASTNEGLFDNIMEPGDTFTVTFSEPIDPTSIIAANVKQLDPSGPGNDGMIIVGLSDGPIDLGSDLYVLPDGGTIVYQDSTLTLLDGGTKIRSTIAGACTGTACLAPGPGELGMVTFRPEPFLRDLAGNHATGSHSEAEGVF